MPCLKLQRQNTDLKVYLEVLITEPSFLEPMKKLRLLIQRLIERIKEPLGHSEDIFLKEESNEIGEELRQALKALEKDEEKLERQFKDHINEAKIVLKKGEERMKRLNDDEEPDCDSPAVARR